MASFESAPFQSRPCRLLDRVLETDPGKRVVAIKNVTYDEGIFQGQPPHQPDMPPSLILETMAQVAALVLRSADPPDEGTLPEMTAVRNMEFRRRVTPGDQLRVTAEARGREGRLSSFAVKAEVNGEWVAAGEIVLG